jgi:hypothetical protein
MRSPKGLVGRMDNVLILVLSHDLVPLYCNGKDVCGVQDYGNKLVLSLSMFEGYIGEYGGYVE